MVGEIDSSDPLMTNDNFSQVFGYLGKTAIAAGIILWLIGPMLRRLMGGQGPKEEKGRMNG